MPSYNYEELNITQVLQLLRSWREDNERRSEEVVELWEAVLEDNATKLGNEKHVLLEQVIFAALDCHRYEVADACIGTLSAEFPGSSRVMRYRAMKLEALERIDQNSVNLDKKVRGKMVTIREYDEALELLEALIAKDETNAAPRKRKVAILKAQGQTMEAIKELVDYLKKFMSDVEAWQELCELYLTVQEYSKAVFCCEELLLHQPHSHLFHQRVADIRYTIGGVENMELAKTYYCQALKLNPDNMRALLGLFLVTNNLATHYKSGGTATKRKDIWKLSQWALNNITAKYRESGATGPCVALHPANKTDIVDPLEGMLVTLSITN